MPSAETNILNRLASAPTFHPVTADLFVDDWGLDAGDVVSVKSGNTTYSVPIYNMELDWHGSARAQIQSTGNRERKPLSALKRKEFRTGRGGYGTKKTVDEQGVQYERHFEATDKRITSTMRATGVLVDENGNPVMVYNPETGEYEYAFDTSGQGVTLASRVWQTAGEMGTLVEMTGINNLGQEETLYSKITQNAQNITLEAARRQNDVNTLSGRITVEAGKITQIVEAVGEDGDVTAASIVAAINDGASSVVISADHIELDGDTVASILYGKQVEVDEINAATSDLDTLDVETRLSVNGTASFVDTATFQDVDIQAGLTVDAITLNGRAVNVVDASASGNVLTITKADGSTVTFSKATALSGGWNSGVFTVDATQNNVNVGSYTTTITQGATTWSGTTATVAIVATDSTSGGYSYNTGRNISVDASGIAGIDTMTKNAESTNPRDYDSWLGTSIGTLTEDTYYQIKATPNSGASAFIKFKTAASSGGQGGIASVTAGGWTWANNTYTNTVTAVANDGTSDTADVTLPTISCQVGLGTSNNATIRPYGPGNHILPTGTSLTLYLKSDNDYVYITNANATPVAGTNVVARAGNTAQGGIASVALNAHSDDVSDWNDWTYSSSASISDRYALIKATPNSGNPYYFGVNASGVWQAGYDAAPVGLATPITSAIVRTATTDDYSTASAWGADRASETDGKKHVLYTITTADGVSKKFRVNASTTYTAGYNDAPVGLASGTGLVNWVASSNDSSVYDGWAYQDTISMGGYKYRQYEVVAADGSKAYIKVHAENTYNAGVNSVVFNDDFVTREETTDDSSVYQGWVDNLTDGFSTVGAKYIKARAVMSSGVQKSFRINASTTYTAGRNAGVAEAFANGGDNISLGSSTSYSSVGMGHTSRNVTGYIWYKDSSGTWQRMKNANGTYRSFSINATNLSARVYRLNSDDEYEPYPANNLIWTW